MKVAIRFEPRDIWIGVYWDWLRVGRQLKVCLCVVPMLPIVFTIQRRIP